MSNPSIAEFAQYRFVRDEKGNVVPLPAQGMDEKILLVLDCEHWALARLHIFEEAAVRKDKLDAFQEELQLIAELRHPNVSRLISWGRDGEELFYADEMLDGEPLPSYLGRAGGIPFSCAADWILQIYDLFSGFEEVPPSFQRFSTQNFQVILDRYGNIRPVFSEFYGWTKPGAQVQEHEFQWYLAQVFCSLIAGVPIRTFHSSFLPRNFDELDNDTKSAVVDALNEKAGSSGDSLKAALEALASSAAGERSQIPFPLLPVREWLRFSLAESYEGGAPDYVLSEGIDLDGPLYGIPTRLRGSSATVQVLPGPSSIPREGWLAQHHNATRRPGRGLMHQLHVNYIEDRDPVTLIGEESVEGVDLRSLLRETGGLDLDTAMSLSGRIEHAITQLEKHVGACAVWWLPANSVFLITGTRSAVSSAQMIGRKGESCWAEFPLKVRLHQTAETMRDLVRLPSAVRELMRLPGKGKEPVRRSAVAVPLVWKLLTGEPFPWSQSVIEHEKIPASFVQLFEQYRVALKEDPESIETDFFSALSRLHQNPPEEISEPETEAEEEMEDNFEEVLDEALYSGEIDQEGISPLPADSPDDDLRPEEPEPEIKITKEILDEEAISEPDGGETRSAKSKDTGKRMSSVWLWLVIGAIVVATVTGYFLSGWNQELGVYEPPEQLSFPETDYQKHAPEYLDSAMDNLKEYFVSRAGTEAVKWLPLLKQLDNPANLTRLRDALRENSEQGDEEAAQLLGLLYLKERKVEDAANAFSQAAESGNTDSRFLLAELKIDSDFTPEVRGHLASAAEAGNAHAGELYAVVLAGEGKRDDAFRFMQSSATSGNVDAQYQLGLFYANRIGTEEGATLAASSFLAAAQQGHREAMVAIGKCYEQGYGLDASSTEAKRWMKKAASLGSEEAIEWCSVREDATSENSEQE